MNEQWIPDKTTYNEIQKLIRFVDFVGKLDFASDKDKQKATEIMSLIPTINHPGHHKNWCVCLDIFDPEVQYGNNLEGFYWRTWSVFFEDNMLSIDTNSSHTAAPLGHYGDDFSFHGVIFFNKELVGRRIYLDENIDEFVNDAENYKNYITETLKDIEIDIDIW